MDERCDGCGFGYESVDAGNAAATIRREADRLAEELSAADPDAAIRRRDEGWSALQYGGHVRDVLVAQRERLLSTRLSDGFSIATMGPDERVAWGEYEGLVPEQIGGEVRLTAGWLANSFDLMAADDWSRTLIYNYPEPSARTLRWLAAHTVHELVHHRQDIQQLLATDG